HNPEKDSVEHTCVLRRSCTCLSDKQSKKTNDMPRARSGRFYRMRIGHLHHSSSRSLPERKSSDTPRVIFVGQSLYLFEVRSPEKDSVEHTCVLRRSCTCLSDKQS